MSPTPPPDSQPNLPLPDEMHRHTTPEERRRAFRILFVCQLAIGMAQTLIYAVLPPIARRLGMGEFETTMMYSLSSFLWMATSPYWGRRSDTIGRKPVIMLGILSFAISTLIFALLVLVGLLHWLPLTYLFPLLLLSRGIFGGVGSGLGSASQAYIADRTARTERASSVASLAAAYGLGTAVGPGVAAAFAQLHILAPFFAVALMAFVSSWLLWKFLPERTAPSNHVTEKRLQRAQLKWLDRKVVPWVVVSIFASLAQMMVLQLCAFYFMDTLRLTDDQATQMVSVGLMAMAISTLFAQIGLIQRFNLSILFLMRWGTMTVMLALLLIAVGNSYGLLVTGLTLCGLGFGLFRPGMSAGASLSVSRHDQGAMAGFMSSTYAMGTVLIPFTAIPLYHWHHKAPFIAGIVLMGMVLAFAFYHPLMKDMNRLAEDVEEEEDGLGFG